MSNQENSRREFLQTTLVSAAALSLTGNCLGADDADSKGLPTRPLGKTGERVSLLCLGGWHIGAVKDEKEAIRIMHTAIGAGLTFFDNAWDYHNGRDAQKRNVGVLGMKSLGGGQPGRFVAAKVCTAQEAIRFALSQPITSLITGIDSLDVLNQNLAITRAFKPLTGAELEALLAKVKPVAGDGRHERFKSTQIFDAEYHQKQHAFTK